MFQGRVPDQHEFEEGDQEAAPGGAADCGQDPQVDDQDPPPTEGHEPAVGARDSQPRWGGGTKHFPGNSKNELRMDLFCFMDSVNGS